MGWVGFLALAASLAEPSVAATQVVHRGQAYDVTYHAHVETRQKSIGMAPPARPSHERCERTVTVVAERRIAAPDGQAALVHRLPATRTWRESVPGACSAANKAAQSPHAPRIARFLAETARQDHHLALAAIEAAHALAAR